MPLKVHKHEIFCLTFFAETQTLWSQGPVIRDFWKSYSIRPRYSTFKHFRLCSATDEISIPRMFSQQWNSFRLCSVCDEIRFKYAQHGCTCKNCSPFTTGWACGKIRSSYAQCAMKSVPRMLSVSTLQCTQDGRWNSIKNCGDQCILYYQTCIQSTTTTLLLTSTTPTYSPSFSSSFYSSYSSSFSSYSSFYSSYSSYSSSYSSFYSSVASSFSSSISPHNFRWPFSFGKTKILYSQPKARKSRVFNLKTPKLPTYLTNFNWYWRAP